MKRILPFLILITGFSFIQAQTYPPLEIYADAPAIPPGGTVDVSVRAGQNFQNIVRLDGTLLFDTTVITFNQMTFFGLSNPNGLTMTYQGGGVLTWTWSSLITIGPTLSSGAPIFTLRFNVVGAPGSSSPLTFSNTPQQMYWMNGFGWQGPNFSAGNGSVTIICGNPNAAFTTQDSLWTVDFGNTNSSSGANYLWSFGDGSTSTQQNPTHTYSSGGNYTVCLIIQDSCGGDTACQTLLVCPPPAAAFTTSPNELVISFSDASANTATAWAWDFGDGSTSTQQNPTHTYTQPGTYTVCLIATGPCGADTICNAITASCNPPNPAFTQSPSGLNIAFSDQSTNGATSWLWDFGDGSTSTQQNPTHTYAAGGTYTVCLTVSSICGSDSTCSNVTAICPLPVTSFADSANNLAVFFSDLSTNAPVSWLWNFGDGNASSSQNPFHVYNAAGTYTVCLIVSNNCGSDTTCRAITVSCPVPLAGFTHSVSAGTVQFTDQSTQTPNAWAWDFGDGATSSQRNPSHTYAASGTYQVCLISTNNCGADTICDSVSVILTGIETSVDEPTVLIYPNPGQDFVRIQSEQNGEVTVFDALGSVHHRLTVTAGSISEIHTGKFPEGVYFIRIVTQKSQSVVKWVRK